MTTETHVFITHSSIGRTGTIFGGYRMSAADTTVWEERSAAVEATGEAAVNAAEDPTDLDYRDSIPAELVHAERDALAAYWSILHQGYPKVELMTSHITLDTPDFSLRAASFTWRGYDLTTNPLQASVTEGMWRTGS